jgi:hypothetical protein
MTPIAACRISADCHDPQMRATQVAALKRLLSKAEYSHPCQNARRISAGWPAFVGHDRFDFVPAIGFTS